MKSFLLEMLQGPKGEVSSKRVLAVLLICSAIAYAFIALFIGKMDAATVGVLAGAGAGLLVGAAVSNT